MSFLSSVGGFFGKIGRAIVGFGRQLGRILGELWGRITGIFDFIFGFLLWPKKYLRIQVRILLQENGQPVVSSSELNASVEYAKRVFKDKLNVELLPYSSAPIIEVMTVPAPPAALTVECGAAAWVEDLAIAGEFFSEHSVGSSNPVTVFVVNDVVDKGGCSLGPLTNYVTLDPTGVAAESSLAHEIGHACGLGVFGHPDNKSRLMSTPPFGRGDSFAWFEKNLFRSSKHVTYL